MGWNRKKNGTGAGVMKNSLGERRLKVSILLSHHNYLRYGLAEDLKLSAIAGGNPGVSFYLFCLCFVLFCLF